MTFRQSSHFTEQGILCRGEPRGVMTAVQKDIRNLLFIIGAGVLCAFALVGYVLYNYGPTGRYVTKNVMLSPEWMSMLTYQEISPHSGKLTKYIFDKVEISYADKDPTEIVADLTVEQYKKIYDLIKLQESLKTLSEGIEGLFYSQPPARLIIQVKPEMAADTVVSKVIFQEVQFAKDSHYYRVQLPEQNTRTGAWVYFEYPNIYQVVMQTLKKS